MVIAGNCPWWLIESGATGRRPFGEGADRHHLIGRRRADVDLVERGGIAEERGQHLLDHIISVHLGEILRDLSLAERVIEGVVDELRLDSIARGHVTVDLERQRRAGILLIGRDVPQFGQRLKLIEDLDRPCVEFVEIGVLQRVLELSLAARAPTVTSWAACR